LIAESNPAETTTHRGAPELAFRLATSDDVPGILRLIAASYGREDDLARLRFWRWKHEANPFGLSPCLIAEANGRLVGVRVFLRWTWRSGHLDVRAVRAVDTATHPDWRGRGIFSRLTTRLVEQMHREGIGFIYNTPNEKSMPGYLKMGWSQVGRIPLWVRPLRLSGLVRRSWTKTPPQPPTFGNTRSASHVLSDPRMPAFLSAASFGDERYHTSRTLPYLRWRYADIPNMTYWARFEMAGDAGALVVARGRVRGRLREVTVSELLVTTSHRGIELGKAVLVDFMRATDADYVAACAASGTTERSVLLGSGFFPIPRLGPHFTARALRTDGPDPSRWDNWRCAIGDLEVF
jgi:GNAT superfamily N-acetyltransferase